MNAMTPRFRRLAGSALATLACAAPLSAARADDPSREQVVDTAPRFLVASAGGWGYDLTGSVVNGGRLDFKNDLNLRASDKKTFALGYIPSRLGWIPALDVDYIQIRANGGENFPATTLFGTVQLAPATTITNHAGINDLELSARWPFKVGPLTIAAGATATRLNGPVVVAIANSSEQRREDIDQVFPLPSLALIWQPVRSLRITARGDYIRYQGDSAETYEATALWKILGPLGIEAGYRHRRYKVVDGNYVLDAKLNGALVKLRYEMPF
jgi:hypothetical protein